MLLIKKNLKNLSQNSKEKLGLPLLKVFLFFLFDLFSLKILNSYLFIYFYSSFISYSILVGWLELNYGELSENETWRESEPKKYWFQLVGGYLTWVSNKDQISTTVSFLTFFPFP